MSQKGITESILQKLKKLGHEEWSPTKIDTRMTGGLLGRLQKYGLVKKLSIGRYIVVDSVKDIIKEYDEKVSQVLSASKAKRRGPRKPKDPNAPPRRPANHANQLVRVTPYGEDQVLIQIGRHLYLATEVALTSKKGLV
jgi:hypothetical protein